MQEVTSSNLVFSTEWQPFGVAFFVWVYSARTRDLFEALLLKGGFGRIVYINRAWALAHEFESRILHRTATFRGCLFRLGLLRELVTSSMPSFSKEGLGGLSILIKRGPWPTSSNLVFSTNDNQRAIKKYSSLVCLYSNTICTQYADMWFSLKFRSRGIGKERFSRRDLQSLLRMTEWTFQPRTLFTTRFFATLRMTKCEMPC